VPNHIDDARVVACYLLTWQGRPCVGPHQDGPRLWVVEGGPCKGAIPTADARGAAANVVVARVGARAGVVATTFSLALSLPLPLALLEAISGAVG
jgi:hypothetical protein